MPTENPMERLHICYINCIVLYKLPYLRGLLYSLFVYCGTYVQNLSQLLDTHESVFFFCLIAAC